MTLRNRTIVVAFIAIGAMGVGSLRNQNFWRTADQRGDALVRQGQFAEAATVYAEPERIGMAQYRAGDFAAAAKTFARDATESGAFNQGNSWLMQGKYDDAITSYDRALAKRPNWKEAVENRALATARRDKLSAGSEENTEQASYQPDKIVFDAKGKQGKPIELSGGEPLSDEALQATWLRRVQTTPGDFLRAKFAYQAQAQESGK